MDSEIEYESVAERLAAELKDLIMSGKIYTPTEYRLIENAADELERQAAIIKDYITGYLKKR